MKFTLILLILINSLISYSQSIENASKIISFELSNSIEYFPSYYNGTKIEYEIFKFNNDRLKHKYSKSKKDKIRCVNKLNKRITAVSYFEVLGKKVLDSKEEELFVSKSHIRSNKLFNSLV